ncbi:MAG: B12-binding domain-containing radical SAM protein [Myxococcales bacterium]|nr:B12-binding domain-containing radical SAM protein [Myxococcales bacterium]
MRLALIFPPFRYKLHEENLAKVQRFFGLFPPLSMAWVAAIAERAGHETLLIDARTLELDIAETARRVNAFRPDLIGYMMTTYMFGETREWIRGIRARVDVPVIVGGFNLRVYPKESIAHPEIDFGVVEQALETLPLFLTEFAGARRYETVPGLVWKEGGEIRMTESRPVRFDDFPHPLRRDLPNDLYAEFPTEQKNFTVMVTSLGCPCGCTFCEVSHTPYNARSPEKVLAEMEECRREYRVREIDLFDYNFTFDRRRTTTICEEMLRRDLRLQWACRSRVDAVDRPLLKLMSESGCRRIYYGIESDSPDKLSEMHKGITLTQVEDAIRATREAGIKTLGFFLTGVAGETAETIKRTVHYATRLNLDYAQFSKLTAKPGSPMWQDMLARTGDDYWRKYILGQVEERELERPWTALTNDEINRLTKLAYLRFYVRPGFLWRSLLGIRTWTEFKRKTRALFSMIFAQSKRAVLDTRFKAYQENPHRRLRKYVKPAPADN